MKRFDIDKIFGLLVREYLDKGYVINTGTMGGAQGEIAKVDLMKDGTFIRISLNKGYECGYIETHDTLYLVVGKRTTPIGKWETVWTKDLEDVERHVFWQIGKDWWTGFEEYAKGCYAKRANRLRMLYDHIDNLKVGMVFFSASAKKIVLDKIRDFPKCRSVKLCDIGDVWRVLENGKMNYKAKVKKYYDRNSKTDNPMVT